MRRLAITLLAGLALLAAAPVASARYAGRGDPVVIQGSALPKLGGVTAGDLVAFRFRLPKHGRGRFKQVPVQLDERKLVDFGSAPPDNSVTGTEGTVYGTAPIGQAVLQYADPDTFVGADPVAGLDGDDEVAMIAADAGDKARLKAKRRKRPKRPQGTVGPATRVKITDPLGGPNGFVYLYRSDGSLDPSAGRDYVDYDFELASGDYRATYRRADGPNPETSTISTADYSIGFSDRWFFDALAINAGSAPGVDILDGFKFQFGPRTCGRSEATFNDAEGAFVANLDGPVRAIRAYVGANSGPLTERTNVFWPDRHQIITDLRVHTGIPGPLTYHDLSAAGLGMTYRDSLNPAGVAVDGVARLARRRDRDLARVDGCAGVAGLHRPGRVELRGRADAAAHDFYLDQANVPGAVEQTCWGDPHAYGQAGFWSTYGPPNTDPRLGPAATLQATTTDLIRAPGVDAAGAERAAAELDSPLQTTIH